MLPGIQTAALLRYFWKHDKFPHNLGFLVFWIKTVIFHKKCKDDIHNTSIRNKSSVPPIYPKGKLLSYCRWTWMYWNKVHEGTRKGEQLRWACDSCCKTSQRSKYRSQTLYFPSSHTRVCAHTDRKHELRSGSLILQGGIWSKICFWRFSSKCSFCLC